MISLSPSFPPMPSKPLGPSSREAGTEWVPTARAKPALHPRGGGRIIRERDGIGADPEAIFLTDGASKGVQTIPQAPAGLATDGIMIPIPSTRSYSATITLYEGRIVPTTSTRLITGSSTLHAR